MKKYAFALLPLLSLAALSCEPRVFTMNIDMRHPSTSGMDFSGKTMSVVWLDDLSGRDEAFSPALAESFSQTLESDYFAGRNAIEIYRMEKDFGGAYASRDTLVNLVLDTGDDVVFLFDAPRYGQPTCSSRTPVAGSSRDSSNVMSITVPYELSLYVYDSMGADTVRVFNGSSDFQERVFCSPDESDEDVLWRAWKEYKNGGVKAGVRSARNFLSQWKPEQYTLVYYETPEAWNTGAQAAYEYRWKDAVNAWMLLLDTKNLEKRSCAEYNIATACYLMGDYELALKWLDRSDADKPISLSPGLRKRINSRIR